MKTREEAAAYGLTFPDSYEDRPFKDGEISGVQRIHG